MARDLALAGGPVGAAGRSKNTGGPPGGGPGGGAGDAPPAPEGRLRGLNAKVGAFALNENAGASALSLGAPGGGGPGGGGGAALSSLIGTSVVVRARSDRAATVDTSPGLNRRKKASYRSVGRSRPRIRPRIFFVWAISVETGSARNSGFQPPSGHRTYFSRCRASDGSTCEEAGARQGLVAGVFSVWNRAVLSFSEVDRRTSSSRSFRSSRRRVFVASSRRE